MRTKEVQLFSFGHDTLTWYTCCYHLSELHEQQTGCSTYLQLEVCCPGILLMIALTMQDTCPHIG